MNDYQLNRNKQLAINLCSTLVAFGVNLLISFFLSPYIIETLGVEANGFISLANTFVMYATLLTIALNSMSGRFISIAIHQNDYELANKYYTAVFGGNIIITMVMILPTVLLIWKLESVINVPNNILFDVKLLFSILFLNFFLVTVVPNWSIATFVTNKIHLNSLRGIEANLLKISSILLLFIIFSPRIYYVAIGTIIATIYTTFFAKYYKGKLLPELKISRIHFKWNYVAQLVSSGIWNTINQTGHLLLSGLDLLIANMFIGSIEMGTLSLAKTLPNIIIGLSGTITGIFMPSLTIDYANGNKEAIKSNLKQGMRLTSILLTIPISVLIVFGKEFYQLWVPTQDAVLLQKLSILTCFGLVFTSGIQVLYNIFTIANKIKTNSVILLISGVISSAIVFILLKTTNLGILAIAGVSSFINLLRNMCYTVPFAAKYIDLRWNTFYNEVLKSCISVCIISFTAYILKSIISIDSWSKLIIVCFITGVIGLILNMLIILSNDERERLILKIRRYLRLKYN